MTFPDPAWLDQQYNALASVPDAPAIFKRWNEKSAQARGHARHQLDVRYGKGAKQTLDWFSSGSRNAPVLVFIHGGFWRGSDKAAHAFIAPSFLAKGCDVVVLNYDLCPVVALDALILQVAEGMALIYRQLASRGCDPTRMVVAGHSAGGHLAAMMLARDWGTVGGDLPADLVSRGLAISGLFDLEPFRHAPFLKDDLRLDEHAVRHFSPVLLRPPRGRVLNAAVGGLESAEFHRQTNDLVNAWGQSIVPIAASIPAKHHFTVLEDLASPGTSLHDMACSLLDIDR